MRWLMAGYFVSQKKPFPSDYMGKVLWRYYSAPPGKAGDPRKATYAVDRASSILQRWGIVEVGRGREDDIPLSRYVVNLRSLYFVSKPIQNATNPDLNWISNSNPHDTWANYIWLSPQTDFSTRKDYVPPANRPAQKTRVPLGYHTQC